VSLKLLLDEHISPSLTTDLAKIGVYAQEVAHVGLSGRPDHAIWCYALQNELAVVTANAADFIELLDVELHPGLILLRESGLTRSEQWMRIEPVVRFVLAQSDQDYLVNRVMEITKPGQFRSLQASGSS
jgi:predicted nuclease of predicted toxin-antitoxin system